MHIMLFGLILCILVATIALIVHINRNRCYDSAAAPTAFTIVVIIIFVLSMIHEKLKVDHEKLLLSSSKIQNVFLQKDSLGTSDIILINQYVKELLDSQNKCDRTEDLLYSNNQEQLDRLFSLSYYYYNIRTNEKLIFSNAGDYLVYIMKNDNELYQRFVIGDDELLYEKLMNKTEKL